MRLTSVSRFSFTLVSILPSVLAPGLSLSHCDNSPDCFALGTGPKPIILAPRPVAECPAKADEEGVAAMRWHAMHSFIR